MVTKISHSLAVFLVLIFLAACTNAQQVNNNLTYNDPDYVSDPLEEVNRAIFSFNNFVDTIVIKPLAQSYEFFLPQFARDSIQSFLRNLSSPVVLANELLQGDWEGVGNTTARFVVNTAAGLGGLIDVANEVGMEYQNEDFGQTLAVWGVPDGPYVIAPLLGSTNVRDFFGMIVDIFFDPINIISANANNNWIPVTRTGVAVIDTRARLIDPLDQLKRDSLDYYASIKSVYKQFREAQISDQGSESLADYTATADIPDYEEY